MIKFYRRIRQKLLTENKFSRYLLYAIGEITLVVIGILIALWINNLNNENQSRKIEIKYLNEIKNNLKLDVGDILFNIDFNQDKLKSNEIVLVYLNQNFEYSDSLNFHFSNLLGSTRSIVNLSAYENLKSRGLEIISNDSLRQIITKVYSTSYNNIIDFEFQDDHRHQYNVLWPAVVQSINIKTMWTEASPIDIHKIKSNYQLKNAISTNIFIRKYMINNYKKLKIEVLNLIDQIEQELKLKNEG